MIKRGIICFIIFILISSFVLSEDISLTKTPKNTAMIHNANQAEYIIKIHNYQSMGDRFRFSVPVSHWNWLVTTEPSVLDVGARQENTFILKITPLFPVDPGQYTIPVKLSSRNNDSIYLEDTFDLEIITYEQAIKTSLKVPDDINPNQENIIKLEIENSYNIELKNLEVVLESDFFSVSKDLNISKFENLTKNFLISFTGNVEKGNHPVLVKFYSSGDLVLEKEYEMDIGDYKKIKAIETPEEGFLFRSEKIIKTNDGNLVLHETYAKELSYFEKLIAKVSPEPTSITKQGMNYILEWELDIEPGETIIITIEKDYRKFIFGLIALVVLLGLFYSYKKKDLILTKNISSIRQSKDGVLNMDVILKLKNKSRRTVKNIKLLDTIHHMIDEPSHFSEIKPRIIKTSEITNRLLWNITKLNGKSSFVVSYNIKVKHKRISDLKIPKAVAKYIKLKRRKLVYSNIVKPF